MEFVENELKKLIESENKKNPYTDEQLADMLSMRRDAVTTLRSELNIPDSRERRKPYLVREIKEILSKNKDISNRQLTKIIQERGFEVSRFLVSSTREEIEKEPGNFDRKEEMKEEGQEENFQNTQKSRYPEAGNLSRRWHVSLPNAKVN